MNVSLFGNHHVYVFESDGKYYMVLDCSEVDEGHEISNKLYELLVKELGVQS